MLPESSNALIWIFLVPSGLTSSTGAVPSVLSGSPAVRNAALITLIGTSSSLSALLLLKFSSSSIIIVRSLASISCFCSLDVLAPCSNVWCILSHCLHFALLWQLITPWPSLRHRKHLFFSRMRLKRSCAVMPRNFLQSLSKC